jgi:hypothetical protein
VCNIPGIAYHSKKNHIDVHYNFFRDMVEEKKVFLVKVDTLDNFAYSLEMFVRNGNFSCCRESMVISTLNC